MIKNKIVCIIPVRKNSKRLKNKNFLKINNKIILNYTIEAAIKSKIFNKIIITSDSEIAKKSAKKYQVIFKNRPKKLADDKSSVADVSLNLLKTKELANFEYFCVLYATAPQREAKDIIETFNLMIKEKNNYSMAVTKLQFNPYGALIKLRNKFFYSFPKLKGINSKGKFYIDNGSTYFAKVKCFLKEKTFQGKKCSFFIMPPEKSIDLNDEEDLKNLKKNLK